MLPDPPEICGEMITQMPTRPKTLLAVPFDCYGIHLLNR